MIIVLSSLLMINTKDSNYEKGSEERRPPWRSVSVSTLPKPDKTALLRAKLLDASRRLRAGKTNVGVQANISKKYVRDAQIDKQNDLIEMKDSCILTDTTLVKKRSSSDDYILTYSVSQMTSPFAKEDVGCQTSLPKFDCMDFIKHYNNFKPVFGTQGNLSDRNIPTLNYNINSNDPYQKTYESSKLKREELVTFMVKPQSISEFKSQVTNKEIRNTIYDWSILLDKLIVESNFLMDNLQADYFRTKVLNSFKEIVAPPNLNGELFEKPMIPSNYWLPVIEERELRVSALSI